MKGTRLWQGPGSPLIQGRSRQVGPFWQPWVASASVALAVSLGVAWLLLHSLPLLPLTACSIVSAALGVWVGRQLGSVRGIYQGLAIALAVDLLAMIVLVVWFPAIL